MAADDYPHLYREEGIPTAEALGWLIEHQAHTPGIQIAFGSSYDVNMILADLDPEESSRPLPGDGLDGGDRGTGVAAPVDPRQAIQRAGTGWPLVPHLRHLRILPALLRGGAGAMGAGGARVPPRNERQARLLRWRPRVGAEGVLRAGVQAPHRATRQSEGQASALTIGSRAPGTVPEP